MGTDSKINLTPFLAALALAGCAALAPERAALPGVSYFQVPGVAGEIPQVVHVVEIDLAHPGVALEVTAKDPAGGRAYRAQTTSEFAARQGLRAAVNGAFFQPFRSGLPWSEDYYPRSGDPVDALPGPAPRATVCIESPARVRLEKGEACAGSGDHALTAGPMLLASGETQAWPLERARHPRTAFGLSADRSRAWMVVVDGRQAVSAGATLGELAEILRGLGAADAVNLDGGGSSTLVLDEGAGPRVVNTPVHTGVPGRERPTATHLGVRVR